jgi:hypothetical protein
MTAPVITREHLLEKRATVELKVRELLGTDGDNNQQMWSLYANALVAMFNFNDPNAGDKWALQLMNRAFAATWDDPRFGPYRLAQFADILPKYQPLFEIADRVTDGYGEFISSCNIVSLDPVQQKQYADLVKQQSQARSDYEDQLTACTNDYTKYVRSQLAAGQPAQNENTWQIATGWDDTLDGYYNIMDNASVAMNNFLQQSYAGKLWAKDLIENYSGKAYK